MAELKDSGARRNFETGAVRDIADGKGRCDLLPLCQVAALLDDGIIKAIGDYEESGNTSSLQKAIGLFSDMVFGSQYTAMLEAAKQYEDGCQKYGERNWQKGIPVHCYIDSGVRHYLKFRRGDVDEPHDRAFIWNMLGAIWTHENKPELIDLPFAAAVNPATPITTEDNPVEPWGEDEARMGEWISVRERLPGDGNYVLVIASGKPRDNLNLDGAYEFASYLKNDGGWFFDAYPDWETPTVTHWMPLPEPPKEE